MKHIILVWCSNTKMEAHEFPLLIEFHCNKEDVEVRGNIPQHCPVCDHALTQLERDGLLAEVGEEADKIINKLYPGIYLRILPLEMAI